MGIWTVKKRSSRSGWGFREEKLDQHPFKNGVPGEDWFLGFKKRHDLSIKKPESIEYARKKMTDPFVIIEYFDLLKRTMEELELEGKPAQVWNLDETSFCLDPTKTKVVGKKGSPASRTTSGPGKDNTTVLAACNAAGNKAPPLIIFKGVKMWDQLVAPEDKSFRSKTKFILRWTGSQQKSFHRTTRLECEVPEVQGWTFCLA
jgi:hypothetical protein